jgi:hypothetical protein
MSCILSNLPEIIRDVFLYYLSGRDSDLERDETIPQTFKSCSVIGASEKDQDLHQAFL